MSLDLSKYDGFEVHPCRYTPADPDSEKVTPGNYEVCDREDPDVFCWSVYGHLIPDAQKNVGGIESIADCATEEEANDLAYLLEAHKKMRDDAEHAMELLKQTKALTEQFPHYGLVVPPNVTAAIKKMEGGKS